MTIQQWLFSFKGRIGRRDFWIWMATWIIAMLLLFFVAYNAWLSTQTAFRCMGFSDYSGVDAGRRELVNTSVHPPLGGGQTATDHYLCDDGYRSGCVHRHPERKQIR